jgi:predicted enzyme related to lactoylglutathione lyase
LPEVTSASAPSGTALWFQVDDVDKTFAEWSARGIAFTHGPRKVFWGYGAELQDPDGYLVRLWDQRLMAEK